MPVEGEVKIEDPTAVRLKGLFKLGDGGVAKFQIGEDNTEIWLTLGDEQIRVFTYPASTVGHVTIFDKKLYVTKGSITEDGLEQFNSGNNGYKTLDEELPPSAILELSRVGLFTLKVSNKEIEG